MRDITLHFRVEGSPRCAVCGADLDRPVSNWWLTNSWTRDRRYYTASETDWPGGYSTPCGAMPEPTKAA